MHYACLQQGVRIVWVTHDMREEGRLSFFTLRQGILPYPRVISVKSRGTDFALFVLTYGTLPYPWFFSQKPRGSGFGSLVLT